MRQPLVPYFEALEAEYWEIKEDPHRLEVEDHQDPLAHQEEVHQQGEVPQQEDTELVEEPEEDQEEEEN
jgi:hypothetical protein